MSLIIAAMWKVKVNIHLFFWKQSEKKTCLTLTCFVCVFFAGDGGLLTGQAYRKDGQSLTLSSSSFNRSIMQTVCNGTLLSERIQHSCVLVWVGPYEHGSCIKGVFWVSASQGAHSILFRCWFLWACVYLFYLIIFALHCGTRSVCSSGTITNPATLWMLIGHHVSW